MTQKRDIRIWLLSLLGLLSAVVVLYTRRTMLQGFVLPRQALLGVFGWSFLLVGSLAARRRPEIRLQLAWPHVFYGLYVLTGFVSIAAALAPGEALIGALRYAAAFALMVGVRALLGDGPAAAKASPLSGAAALPLPAGMAGECIAPPIKTILPLVCLLSASVTLCAALTVVQYFKMDGWWRMVSRGVGGSFFGNKNMAADVYSIAFPLPLLLFWSRRAWARVCGAGLCALIVCGLILTTSEGAVIGLVMGAAWMIILTEYRKWPGYSRRRRCVHMAVALALTLAAVLFARETQYFRRLLSGKNESAHIRLVYWQNGLVAIREHALLGVGVDNYRVWHNKYANAAAHTWTLREDRRMTLLHNEWLQSFADQGIPGGVLYTLFWATIVWFGFIAARAAQGAWAIPVAGALAASFGNSLFGIAYHRPVPVLFLGILTGLLVAAAAGSRPIRLFPVRPAVMILLSFSMLALGVACHEPYLMSDTLAARGMALFPGQPELAVPLFERALKLFPSHRSPINPLVAHYSERRDFDNLLRIIEDHGLRYDPYNPYTLRIGAEAYRARGEYEAAWRYLNRIRSFMPAYQAWYDSALRLAHVSGDHGRVVALAAEAMSKRQLSELSLPLAIQGARLVRDRKRYETFSRTWSAWQAAERPPYVEGVCVPSSSSGRD